MVNERSSTSKVGRVMRSFESHTLSSVDGPLPSFLAGGRPSLVCARPGAASCPPRSMNRAKSGAVLSAFAAFDCQTAATTTMFIAIRMRYVGPAPESALPRRTVGQPLGGVPRRRSAPPFRQNFGGGGSVIRVLPSSPSAYNLRPETDRVRAIDLRAGDVVVETADHPARITRLKYTTSRVSVYARYIWSATTEPDWPLGIYQYAAKLDRAKKGEY